MYLSVLAAEPRLASLASLTIEAASAFATLANQSSTCARAKMSLIYELMPVMQRSKSLVTFCMKGGYPLGKRRNTSKSRITSASVVFGDANNGMTNTLSRSKKIYNTLNCFAIEQCFMDGPSHTSFQDATKVRRSVASKGILYTRPKAASSLLFFVVGITGNPPSSHGSMRRARVDLAQRCTD